MVHRQTVELGDRLKAGFERVGIDPVGGVDPGPVSLVGHGR
jgi:hypothetical protein